jgi:hypothetical protein
MFDGWGGPEPKARAEAAAAGTRQGADRRRVKALVGVVGGAAATTALALQTPLAKASPAYCFAHQNHNNQSAWCTYIYQTEPHNGGGKGPAYYDGGTHTSPFLNANEGENQRSGDCGLAYINTYSSILGRHTTNKYNVFCGAVSSVSQWSWTGWDWGANFTLTPQVWNGSINSGPIWGWARWTWSGSL